MKWLINETLPISKEELCYIGELDRSAQNQNLLAVTLKDIIIHDNKKWFGEADIRIDALVVNGYGQEDEPGSFYMPRTATFSRVQDGEHLSIGEGGLLIFHGATRHFLDIRIMVSRDSKDTDSLASLLKHSINSNEVKGALGSLMNLAVAAPQTAIIAGISGAAVLADFAFQVLRKATGSTIGLFQNSHREHSDSFGIGPHPIPPKIYYRANDLSFRYDITLEQEEDL